MSLSAACLGEICSVHYGLWSATWLQSGVHHLSLRKLTQALIGLAIPAAFSPSGSMAAEPADQTVIVYLKLADNEFGAEGESFALYGIEDAVESAIATVGELDGHEIGGGYFTIFTYGKNADVLFQTMRPALNDPLVRPGSYVLVRRGGPSAPTDRVELETLKSAAD